MEWFGGRDGGGWCGVVGGVVGGGVGWDFGGKNVWKNAVVREKEHQHQWRFPTRKTIDWGDGNKTNTRTKNQTIW